MTHEPITATAIFKNLGYIGAIFIGLTLDSFLILAVFMIIDTILGVLRVGIVHGGRAIKSYRLVSGLVSKLTLVLIPLLIVYTGQGIGIDLQYLATSALSILILSHAYSIFGNIHSIRLRKDVYEFDAVSWLLTRIQLVIEKLIKQGAPDKMLDAPDTNRDLQKHEHRST